MAMFARPYTPSTTHSIGGEGQRPDYAKTSPGYFKFLQPPMAIASTADHVARSAYHNFSGSWLARNVINLQACIHYSCDSAV